MLALSYHMSRLYSLKQVWRTLDDLPRALVTAPVNEVEEERAQNPSSCQDSTKDCSKPAAHYCVKCDKRLCKQLYTQVDKTG